MTINEQIVTGRKFRKLIDEASRLWLRVSFWTKASDVEFDDGEDAETKISIIQTIINNLKESFNNFKESVQNSLNNIHENLGGCKIEQEGNNFYIVGADSVRKKLGNVEEGVHVYNSSLSINGGESGTGIATLPFDPDKYKLVAYGVTLVNMTRCYDSDSQGGGIHNVTSSIKIRYYSHTPTLMYFDFTHASGMNLEQVWPGCTINFMYVLVEI